MGVINAVLTLLALACFSIAEFCCAAPTHLYPNDFDGDGVSDLCVWRPSTGQWYCVPSSNHVIPGWAAVGAGPGSVVQWGLPGDKLAPADYDGDGRTDPAVIRPGYMNWYVRKSTGGTSVAQLGLDGDVRTTGNQVSGAGDDYGVYRPSNDRIYCRAGTGPIIDGGIMPGSISGISGPFAYFGSNQASNIYTRSGNIVRWRSKNCQTTQGGYLDYNAPSSAGMVLSGAYLAGDLAFDVAHFENDVWTIYKSIDVLHPVVVTWGWGYQTDVPVVGDFDGDRLADLAVYNSSNGSWRVLASGYTHGYRVPHMWQYGSGIPGDYWYQWGQPGDIPIE